MKDQKTEWDIEKLYSDLGKKYKEKGLDDYWTSEGAEIKHRFEVLSKYLSNRYTEPEIGGLGGSGIVLRLMDLNLPEFPCALKFSRPVAGLADLLGEMMDKEISYLAGLRHRSIIRIHEKGKLPPNEGKGGRSKEFPFYVMDWVEGKSSSSYFSSKKRNEEDLIRVLEATVDAIDYLHSKGIAHLDIKPENILVDQTGMPIIADLGTAKVISPGIEETIVACTYDYADPELISLLEEDPSDPNRAKGRIPRNRIEKNWDLTSLGKTLLRWMGLANGKENNAKFEISLYNKKYLLLLASRLYQADLETWFEERIGIDKQIVKETRYSSAAAALDDVRKITGGFSIVDKIPELNPYHPETIQIVGETPTTYTQRVVRLLAHPSMRRLASITQLGVINQVYPTATHSRLEHSLGTYHNTCRFVLSLYNDPLNPIFKQIVEPEDICALLVAALLHDVGHFPLAHDLEEIDDSFFSHQRLGVATIRGEREPKKAGSRKISLPPFNDELALWSTTPERVVQIIEARHSNHKASVKDKILHSVIDGPLDADKLDYLTRDSARLGVPYGSGIGVERILRCLTTAIGKDEGGLVACVGIHEKGRVPAEFVVMARYAMYSQAYWHHTVRAMKAMLARSVQALLSDTADERKRNQLQSQFEEMVLSIPASLYHREEVDLQLSLFDQQSSQKSTRRSSASDENSLNPQSTLAATDAAVITFLKKYLEDAKLPEAELLSNILSRKLYKRLFVFSNERSSAQWNKFISDWERLTHAAKKGVYQKIEEAILNRIDAREQSQSITTSVQRSDIDLIRRRIAAKLPIVIIDIPGRKPGSDKPLYYVLESGRMRLRKDERVIGEIKESEVWRRFAFGLRDQAGKIRVFAHPQLAGLLEATISREDFFTIYNEAIDEI